MCAKYAPEDTEMKEILRIAAAISGKAPQDIRSETTLAELGLSSSIKLYRLQYAIEDTLGLELRPLAPGFTIDFIASMAGFSQTKYADDNNFDMAAETPEDISPAIESGGLFVGIDIEEMAGFPKTNNYREHAFYRKVFLNEEISYALLNQTPLQHLETLNAQLHGTAAPCDPVKIKLDCPVAGQ